MNRVMITITGHRILSAAQKKKVKPVLEQAIQNIMFTLKEHDHAVSFVAVSPLAEGADTLFANAARSLGLPLHVILPFERDEYMKDFSSDEVRKEFDSIYDSVEHEHKRVLNTAEGGDINQLYLALGQKLVNETDYLIAVWNEKPGNGTGGTADVVAYAIEKKKNILLINPEDEHPYINYLHPDNYHRRRKDFIDTAETNHLVEFIHDKQKEYDANAVKYNTRYKRVWAAGFIIGLVEVFAFSLIISFHVSLTAHFLLASVEFLCIVTIILLLLFGRSKELHNKYVH